MVRPLEYNSNLNYQEVEERYKEVVEAFEKVKEKYQERRGEMEQEDLKTLTDCLGVVFPLGNEDIVQNEVFEKGLVEDTMFMKLQYMLHDLPLYLSEFSNGGVTIVKGGITDLFD